ncbi:unnamed protein product [Schistosoma rodhaini]|uniref:Reverse transcriptase domain-containing protein n=1 Tax=Schistosoma rodhaini TaxID=6188 RepID=A0AA85EQD2_9TREM|nr:unnamed protein product [Schistosoma rodhaini]
MSLFTNVPLTETICLLFDYNLEICIPKHYLKEPLLRCILNVQFKFNDGFYRQTDGVAMGSPLGPLLSDCFMANLENSALRPVIEKFHFYKRYMDDTFIICEDMDLNEILNIFDNFHPSIQFTLEAEANHELHFLGVRLNRMPDGYLQRSMYRKPTWNGQYTNFHSWDPLSRKKNLIHSLSSRIKRICSNDTINEELFNLQQTLIKNGYPPRFVDSNLTPGLHQEKASTVQKKTLFMNMEFKGFIAAEILNKRISKSLNKIFYAAKLRIIFSSQPTILGCVKDKPSLWATSMYIFKFTCS